MQVLDIDLGQVVQHGKHEAAWRADALCITYNKCTAEKGHVLYWYKSVVGVEDNDSRIRSYLPINLSTMPVEQNLIHWLKLEDSQCAANIK